MRGERGKLEWGRKRIDVFEGMVKMKVGEECVKISRMCGRMGNRIGR
jgi:hypothetical protein